MANTVKIEATIHTTMTGRLKSILSAAAMVGGALAIAPGCTSHQEIDQTMPPYAYISDESRDPASAPTPAPSPDTSSGSGGILSATGNAIGTVVMFPFHLVGQAFGSN
jgi:hypothetical protein